MLNRPLTVNRLWRAAFGALRWEELVCLLCRVPRATWAQSRRLQEGRISSAFPDLQRWGVPVPTVVSLSPLGDIVLKKSKVADFHNFLTPSPRKTLVT